MMRLMPALTITTNQTVGAAQTEPLLRAFSAEVARVTGKPESYVMVSLQAGGPMTFAGTTEPTAMLQLLSLGLDPATIPPMAEALTRLAEKLLGVPGRRCYTEFRSPPRDHFALDGRTFG